jgi:hypothetical protein
LVSLKTLPQSLDSTGNIKILIIDSVSCFFWMDKLQDEINKTRQRRSLLRKDGGLQKRMSY